MMVSYDQNADQNQDIKVANRSVKNVSQFKYLETTVTVMLATIQLRTFSLLIFSKNL
jgi:hypothetical protein